MTRKPNKPIKSSKLAKKAAPTVPGPAGPRGHVAPPKDPTLTTPLHPSKGTFTTAPKFLKPPSGFNIEQPVAPSAANPVNTGSRGKKLVPPTKKRGA